MMSKDDYVENKLLLLGITLDIPSRIMISSVFAQMWELEQRLNKLEQCCEGGPHWGHSYNCKKVY